MIILSGPFHDTVQLFLQFELRLHFKANITRTEKYKEKSKKPKTEESAYRQWEDNYLSLSGAVWKLATLNNECFALSVVCVCSVYAYCIWTKKKLFLCKPFFGVQG